MIRKCWMLVFLFVATIFAADLVPYGIDKRPMPEGKDLEKLVPLKVGEFQREALPKDTKFPVNEDLNVTYKSGKHSVFFGFSVPGSPEDARGAIEVTRQEGAPADAKLKPEEYRIDKDPGYFKQADFLSWSRGSYFFYAHGNSPQALDSFLKAFPY